MLEFILHGLGCVYVLEDSLAVRVVVLHLVLECEDVDCVKSYTDGLEVPQKLYWSDLRDQVFLVLQLEEPRLIDRV